MTDPEQANVQKWPFVLTDLALCAAAAFVIWRNLPAQTPAQMFLVAIALLVGAWAAYIGLLPWLLNHRTALKSMELDEVSSATGKLDQLDKIASQIEEATGNWRMAQEQSAKLLTDSAAAAQQVLGRANEVTKTSNQAADQEKQTLRLEIEKLRKTEVEWLQVTVRILDHTFALYNAALQSGQTNVIAQLEKFQATCRESARRVGLSPYEAKPGDPFNPKAHQPVNPAQAATPEQIEGATVDLCIAPGFTFQGQPVRKPLVSLISKEERAAREAESAELPLEEPAKPENEEKPQEEEKPDPQVHLPL